MRVVRRVHRSDRGAVLVIVAVFALVAVVFLAFVIDIGNQRQDRRQLTTATDAAALDIAQQWSDSSLEPLSGWSLISSTPDPQWDCTPTLAHDDYRYVDENREGANGHSCLATRKSGQLASVSVFAGGITDYRFGPAVGINEGAINSTTSVRIGAAPGGGLRPFAVCARDTDVMAWFNAGGSPRGQEITLGGDKFLPSECQQNNANWGFVQFETQTNGQKTLAEVIREGTTDPLSSFDNGDQGDPLDPYADEKEICTDDADEAPQTLYDDQDPVTCVFNSVGAAGWNNQNARQAFDYLIENQTTFNLPLYGEIQPIGGGQLTGFPIIAFAEVQLIDYNEANGANENDITLRFLGLATGDCCDVNADNQALEICDVGTTSGALLTSFEEGCQTSDATSGGPGNSVPEGSAQCESVQIDPPAALGSVKADNPDKGTLVAEVVYNLEVVDAGDCNSITAVADAPTGPDVDASSVTRTGNVYSIQFAAADKKFSSGTLYTIRVFDTVDGELPSTALLQTNP